MAKFRLDSHNNILGRLTSVDLIIPDAPPPKGGYPVLYLLHDYEGDNSIWTRYTSIERYALNCNFAIAMPDGDHGFYVNSSNYSYEDILFSEIPKKLQHLFNLSSKREDTFIGGAGVGGYGAVREALLHPERYKGAFAISPIADLISYITEKGIDEEVIEVYRESTQGAGKDMEAIAEAYSSRARNKTSFLIIEDKEGLAAGKQESLEELLSHCGIESSLIKAEGYYGWEFCDRNIEKCLHWIQGLL